MPTIRLVNVTKQFGKGSLAVDRFFAWSFGMRQDDDFTNDRGFGNTDGRRDLF